MDFFNQSFSIGVLQEYTFIIERYNIVVLNTKRMKHD